MVRRLFDPKQLCVQNAALLLIGIYKYISVKS